MKHEIIAANILLSGTNISILDAARLIKNILDAKDEKSSLNALEFCNKIIDIGKRHILKTEMSIKDGFLLYLEKKSHLRADSLNNIKYLGQRLFKNSFKFAKIKFSEISLSNCEEWLSSTFNTPNQFNKARTMLHGLFEFAVRHEWCERNIIKLIEKKKIFEMEIKPLSISETKELLKTAKMKNNQSYSIAVGLLTFAGIRPKEVLRLKWQDIDLDENIITVRSQCSKTGGTRHVDICPSLKSLFKNFRLNEESYICPKNWPSQWKNIRDSSGFKGRWIPDVLRHTFASYHAKHFSDLSKLQLNMGHRDQSLLRSRYVNMCGISKSNAREFFNLCI